MFNYQYRWWKLPNFIRAFVGGFGSGKTLMGSKRIISLALQNAPVPVMAVFPTYQIGRNTGISTITELLIGKQSFYGEKLWFRYHQSHHEFTIKFRGRVGRILVYSGENPDSLRGPNVGAAWIDEPFLQERKVFEQTTARIRHPQAVVSELNLTGTPEQLNWGYDVCVGDDKEFADVGLVTASTRQNLTLNPGYVERLTSVLSEKAAEAYVEGKFISLSEGLVYYGFSPSNNVVVAPTPDSAELGVGMDFNVNPMAAVVFWKLGDRMHVFDEIELPNADTQFMASELIARYGKRLRDVYPDASGVARKSSAPDGKSDFWYLQAAGFTINAQNANPLRRDRYNAVNGKLAPRKGAPTLTIAPSCKRLIKYMSTHSFELINKQKQMTHLLDAAGYPVAYLYPVSKNVLELHRLTGW